MSKGLKKAGKIIGGIEDWMVIVLFTAMVVVTMAIVLCRYVFKVQFVPGECRSGHGIPHTCSCRCSCVC